MILLVAEILKSTVDPKLDMVGHIGGDDFIRVLQGLDPLRHLRKIGRADDVRMAAAYSLRPTGPPSRVVDCAAYVSQTDRCRGADPSFEAADPESVLGPQSGRPHLSIPRPRRWPATRCRTPAAVPFNTCAFAAW